MSSNIAVIGPIKINGITPDFAGNIIVSGTGSGGVDNAFYSTQSASALNADKLGGHLPNYFVVNGGALGTPYSGNLVNCTLPTLAYSSQSASALNADKLKTARTINGVAFDGSSDITISSGAAENAIYSSQSTSALNADKLGGHFANYFIALNGALGTPTSGNLINCTFPTLNQNTTGSARTSSFSSQSASALNADKLKTARNINGVAFDGSSDITLPVSAGDNSIYSSQSASAFTADKLNTARNINGIAFDGTSDITIAVGGSGENSIYSSQSASAFTADKLNTARTINGVSFDGTSDITIAVGGSGSLNIINDTTDVTSYVPFLYTSAGSADTLFVSNTNLTFNSFTGELHATVFNSLSDKRKKTNIESINYGLNAVLNMEPVQFDYIDSGKTSLGFIAQDMNTIIPEVVSKDNEGYLGINYSALIPVLVHAIKQLKEELDTLKYSR